MKTLIFICFPVLRDGDQFGGMMPVQDLEDAKLLQAEIGGRILVSTIFFN